MPTNNQQKNALITGANKGIGFGIARRLAADGFRVFVAARSPERGQLAVEALVAGGAAAEWVALDVNDPQSIADATQLVESKTGRLDALVNNAGIFEDDDATILDVDPALLVRTLSTNTLGPLLVTRAFLPLLGPGARVVNVSSGMGQFDEMGGDHPAYRLSKTALNAVTVMLAADLRGRRIAVNAVCPGWVRTDMGGAGAERSVEQGADTPVWLAAEAPPDLTGKFFRDRLEIPW